MSYEHRSDDEMRDDIRSLTRAAQQLRADRHLSAAVSLEVIARAKEDELARRAAGGDTDG